jgi:hypothetical protein
MSATKQDVIDALLALRVNRPRHLADRHISTLLRTYGGGALSVADLRPEFIDAMFVAAGGAGPGIVAAPPRRRPNSLLVADLERRVWEGPKHPRPSGFVSFGNPSLPGERRD